MRQVSKGIADLLLRQALPLEGLVASFSSVFHVASLTVLAAKASGHYGLFQGILS